jgi:hypothetical protein
LNEGTNTRNIADRLRAQFAEHAYALRRVRFWIAEIWPGHQNLYDEMCIGGSPLGDLDAKILAILNKSSFQSTCSLAEALGVDCSTVLLHFHDSIDFGSFH